MKWFYSQQGNEVGPLTESALRELHDSGAINGETMVRSEQSEEWTAYSEVFAISDGTTEESQTNSDMFKFQCPSCGQNISAEANQSGDAAQCPACGCDFVVPEAQNNEAEENAANTNLGERQDNESSETDILGGSASTTDQKKHFMGGVSSAMDAGWSGAKTGARDGWSGLKSRSKQAALQAQIQKLQNMDLRRAHHALGEKCFETGEGAEQLPEQFQAIRDLDARIAELREKTAGDSDETKLESIKRMGKDTANTSHAQALSVKREHLITELGKMDYAQGSQRDHESLKEEYRTITDTLEQIQEKKAEIAKLGNGAKNSVPSMAVAAVVILIGALALWFVMPHGGEDQQTIAVVEQSKQAPENLLTNSLGMKFARVEIPSGPSANETIYFSIWETRRKDYAAFAKSRPDEIEDSKWDKESEASLPGQQNPDSPVIYVNAEDATLFCKWLTSKEREDGLLPENAYYRIPTDHEWSCAVGIGQSEDPDASAPEKNGVIQDIFPWGRTWPPPENVGNIRAEGKSPGLVSVGSFKPGMFGLHDMAGNVAEIVRDDNESVSSVVTRGSSLFSRVSLPKSEFLSSTRVVLLIDHPVYRTYKGRMSDVGFRCVLVVKGELSKQATTKTNELDENEQTEQFERGESSSASEVNAPLNLAKGKVGDGLKFTIGDGEELVMKYVPGGRFRVGSPTDEVDRRSNEGQVMVTLNSHFWIGETEVTQEQWKAVMKRNPSVFKGDSLPVETVSWEDCQKFITRLNTQNPPSPGWRWALPTESQWERACRGGTTTATAYGDSLSSRQANFNGDYPYGGAAKGPNLNKTAPVKSYEPNAYGLYDVHGNVSEWCSDVHVVPSKGSRRVSRGGSWVSYGWSCRSAIRGDSSPDFPMKFDGLRLAVVPSK